jgi:hypothetical protein
MLGIVMDHQKFKKVLMPDIHILCDRKENSLGHLKDNLCRASIVTFDAASVSDSLFVWWFFEQ